MARVLIIGAGNIGGELAKKLEEEGHIVTGLSRTVPTMQSTISFIQADVTNVSQIEAVTLDFDQLVYILSPSTRGINAYKAVFEIGVDNVLKALKKQQANTSLMFVSSSRVYGQQKGEWVSEKSITEPTDERGQILLTAENKFLAFSNQTTIVRFSGIYGRSKYFINQLKKGVEIQKSPPYYSNRVHREDCIGVLAFLLNKKQNAKPLEKIYIASDSAPASKWDVAKHLVSKLKLKPCEPLMLSNEASQNKRLDNSCLLDAGYEFKFKTYKEGYEAAISEQD